MLNKIQIIKSKSELVRSIGNSNIRKFVIIDDIDVSKLNIIRRELIKISPNNKGKNSMIIMSFND